MKGKYITTNMLLAFASQPVQRKSIHAQIEETIAERRRIMRGLEDFSRKARVIDLYLTNEKAA
jgi:hypothetical protein